MSQSKFTNREEDVIYSEFIERFYIKYQLGGTPREIASSLGYGSEIFGTSRLTRFQINTKKRAIRPKGFTEGKGRRKWIQSELDSIDEKPSDETIIKM